MFRFISLLALLSSPHVAAAQWLDQYTDKLPEGTQVSLLISTADGQAVYGQNPELKLTPASTQKMLTATAATLYLGKDYQFTTRLEAVSEAAQGGDFRLVFSGDPSLKRKDLRSLLRKMKAEGISEIRDLILDQSRFSGYQWSNGQAWNDLGVCYTAPASAIVVNHNCVRGNLSELENGESRLYIPAYEPLNISSDVTFVSKQQRERRFCALELNQGSGNNYHLFGCFERRSKPVPLAFSVVDPEAYATAILKAELKSSGIRLKGKIYSDHNSAPEGQLIAQHMSPKLSVLITEMVKDSDNLIADILLKTLGTEYFDMAGSFRNGSEAMRAILKETAGVDLTNSYITDGSGLSRHNLISAQHLMTLMRFIYTNNNKLNLLETMSVSGIDGTLKYRRAMLTPGLKGKVKAKTGSMKGVANMMGVVESKQGPLLFVLMLNGYSLSKEQAKLVSERKIKAPLQLFEQALFKALVAGEPLKS